MPPDGRDPEAANAPSGALFFTIESLSVVDKESGRDLTQASGKRSRRSPRTDYRHHRADRLLDAVQLTARPVRFEGDTEAGTQQRNNQ